ncbi:MAG: 3-isopropylmalate dehydratase small subunit [Candidatus Marinimicrobia bacterium]|nr:3-isopropylmalate dehydratase small subunit [Candidatus Neomarinimicrobiota bacterium]
MEAFKTFTGLVAPLERSNVDTDAIIPKQYLKSIKRTGFGPNLFDEWRYLDHGEPGQDCSKRPLNSDFILNRDPYQKSSILLTQNNFGCGSSREHAPWALLDFGFNVIIAESFAEIFYNNCFKNGILLIVLSAEKIEKLFYKTKNVPRYTLTVDLEKQTIIDNSDLFISFKIEPFRKDALLQGLDEIGLTFEHRKDIKQFENEHKKIQPWLFNSV